jgi:hypothetical protein
MTYQTVWAFPIVWPRVYGVSPTPWADYRDKAARSIGPREKRAAPSEPRTCIVCGKSYAKPDKLSKAEFAKRKACSPACGLALIQKSKLEKQAALLACMPGVMATLVLKSGLEYRTVRATLQGMVIEQLCHAVHMGPGPRTYVLGKKP